jgi:hypothetical protein
MTKETDRFLQAEESAEKLVQALRDLQAQASSYQSATNELNLVREKLGKFIESTAIIAKDTHEAVKTIKEIGGPKILGMLDTFAKFASAEAAISAKRFAQLRILVGGAIALLLLCTAGVIILLVK